MFTLAEVDEAAALVYGHMPPTPQYAWPLLARRFGCEVVVKHENHGPAGAFKLRLWVSRYASLIAGLRRSSLCG